MKKLIILSFCLLIFIAQSCEDKEKQEPEFILNTNIPDGQLYSGFSFEKMKIITGPNPENIIPDFLVACHMNDLGEISKPFLSHPNLESRFVMLNSYDNLSTAKNVFDTLSTISNQPPTTFALDIKPFQIWQVKTTTDEIGLIIIIEAKAEKINSSAFAEIKFKARKITP